MAKEQPLTASEAPTKEPDEPTSFADSRYEVRKFLGEGGKKKGYLAQDTLPNQEVAYALIKTEGLDEVSRTRPPHLMTRFFQNYLLQAQGSLYRLPPVKQCMPPHQPD